MSAIPKERPRMGLNQLRHELAQRLRELREFHFHGMSPEQVAIHAREERQIHIGAKTIRDYEQPQTCNPTLDTLFELLRLYNTTVGDLFSFSCTYDHAVEVADFKKLLKDDDLRKAAQVVLSRLRPQPKVKSEK